MGNKPAKQEKEEIFLKIVPPLDRAYVQWLARDLERIHGFTPRNPRAVKPPDHYIEHMRLNGWLDVDLDDPDLAHLFNNRSKMKKYGLQLRVQPSQQKKQPARPPLPPPLGFRDEDEDDVEKEISRQASKNKALKDIEEQHKKALEEDPSVFDYDGVYDEMKEKVARPLVHDRQEKKPKYIQALIEKTKQREREHEIIYERKLAKERTKDEHLYADKDKFVTSAYKKKLAEQAKWMEEERRRQLREEKEDVTKKKDMTDFYFNLSKNVAFGAEDAETRKSEQQQKEENVSTSEERPQLTKLHLETTKPREEHQGETSSQTEERSKSIDAKPVAAAEQPSAEQPRRDHHKRNEDAVAAAKERFLARKRAK